MMRNRFVVAITILMLISPTAGFASEEEALAEVVVRPLGFAGLVVGSAVFLVTLPASILVGGSDKMAEVLVKRPYQFTFQRGMGEGLKHSDYPSDF
jgi:hypothetical protein